MAGSRASVVVVLALAVSCVGDGSRSCEWGTFSHSVPGPGGTENTDLAVWREGREVRITRDGLAAASTLSPDAARVAFESAAGGRHSDTVGYSRLAIHVADVDGTNRDQLTSGRRDHGPSWAPDGTKVLFLRTGGIWSVDVETKEVELVHRPRSASVVDAEWSGDSSRIAFFVQASPRDDDAELWVVDADGSDARRLATVPEGGVADLAWSPNGQTFAWTAGAYEGRSLFLMPAALGGPRAVETNAETPVWSADGERLAFVVDREGRDGPTVMIGAANATAAQPVPDSPQHIHDWVSC